MNEACTSCGENKGWRFEGVQELPKGAYELWTCQACGSTHLKKAEEADE